MQTFRAMPKKAGKKSSRAESIPNALDATGVSVFAGDGRMLAQVPKAGRAGDASVLPGFDHERALSVLDNLCDTSGVTEKYAKASEDVKSGIDEFRSLKNSKAAEQLAELEAAVSAEREAERAAVDALRQELEETREKLAKTSHKLRSLKENPPAPSEAVIRSTALFQSADGEASRWRSRAEDLQGKLEHSERTKQELMQVLDSQGSSSSSASSASSAAGTGTVATGRASADLEAIKQLFNRFTGLWPESVGADGKSFRCSLDTEDGEAEMEIRLLPADQEGTGGSGASADASGEDEDDVGLIEVQVLKGVEVLPEFMHGHDANTINFDASSGPAFMLQLLSDLVGDDEGEDEGEGAGSATGSAPMDGSD